MVDPDFQCLFDATPIPYLVLTPDFTMMAANEARLRATMTTREQILGRNLFEVFPDNPNDPGATGVRNLRASLTRVLENRCPDAMALQKYDIPRRDAAEGEFEVRYWKPLNSPVFGPTGEVAYIIHSVEDVTEHILKQRAVEESEARFRLIADAMPQMVWSALPDGYHDYYNRQHYEFAGMPVGATIGDNWGSILHPDDLPRTKTAWEHSLATGAPYEIEYRLRHRSGEYHWMLARALPIRNQAGLIERWIGTYTDIHAQKVLRAQLQDAQLRLEGTLSAAEIGTWTWDIQADRVYADCNSHGCSRSPSRMPGVAHSRPISPPSIPTTSRRSRPILRSRLPPASPTSTSSACACATAVSGMSMRAAKSISTQAASLRGCRASSSTSRNRNWRKKRSNAASSSSRPSPTPTSSASCSTVTTAASSR